MDEQRPEFKSPLKRKLRILFVEDNPEDFELCLRELKKAGLNFYSDLVETKSEFEERFRTGTYDIVVSDYQLSGWFGMEALAILRRLGQNTPLILVTGVLGDETAVDCIREGAADYVLKDRLARLPIAINRAMHEHFLIEAREQALRQARESAAKFRTLTETIASAVFIYCGTTCEYANRAAEVITGYSREELLKLNSWDLLHPDSRDTVIQMGFSRTSGDHAARRYEAKIITKAGEAKWLDITSGVIQIAGSPRGLITALDITQRKLAEEEVRQLTASDPLTGLANCRRLRQVFNSERERLQRTGRPFSLILLDLDDLKRINNAHGHLAGSRALCRVGNVLRNQCRRLDTAVRYGGDEFAIILPETGPDEARHLAKRIASTVAEDQEQPRISVSYGLAVCPADGATFKDALKIADGGLDLMKARARKVG